MASFKPFPAIRPAAEYAADTLCPPYDVVDRDEAAEYCKNPVNFMRVIRADALLPEDKTYSKETYDLSRANLDKLMADGVYSEDMHPRYYIYSETFQGRTQTGIVGCASIDEYENGTIKKHEVTRAEKELDRIRHFDVCDADTEPVFLTYKDSDRIKALTESITGDEDPEYETTDRVGVSHRLWPVKDESAIKLLEGLFSDVDCMYIADGHHRSASAVKVGHMKREQYGGYSGVEEFNRFMAVAFPESELTVLPYNRLLTSLSGMTGDEFLSRLSDVADLSEISESAAAGQDRNDRDSYPARHTVNLYMDGKWHAVKFHSDIIDEDDPVKSLDVYLLQEYVFAPLFGITDPRTDKRLAFDGGTGSTARLEKAVDSGKAEAAFSLCPLTVREIMKVADNDLIMPPKSTWFEPKLGSGWFAHRID